MNTLIESAAVLVGVPGAALLGMIPAPRRAAERQAERGQA